MDLELATKEEIIKELRARKMRFVFIGVINTNAKTSNPTMLATQAIDRDDVFRLIQFGLDEFQDLNDDAVESDQED
jgi:hypothetical protein